jgi:hypothetical protein
MSIKMKIVELESKQLTREESTNGPDSDTIGVRYWCKVKVEDEREYVSVGYEVYRTPDEMGHPTAEEFGEFVLFRLTHEDIKPTASEWQYYKNLNALDELITLIRNQ